MFRIRDKTSAVTFRAQCKLKVYLYCKLEVAVTAFVAYTPYCLVGAWHMEFGKPLEKESLKKGMRPFTVQKLSRG